MVGKSRIAIVFILLTLLTAVFSVIGFSQNPEIAVYPYDSGPIPFLDPSDGGDGEVVTMINIYEPLLRYRAQEDTLTPVLATSYEKSNEGRTWTFHLRQGVKFHTGNEMTAQAVKYSFERTMERGKGASYILYPIDSIEVVDDYTVTFHLKYRVPFDLLVASNYCVFVFDPEYSDHDWYLQGNDSGTGPYQIENIKGREEVVLKKFDDYWGGWEGKHFDMVVIKEVTEASTRRMMLESGQADYVNSLPPPDVKDLQDDPNIEISVFSSFQNLVALFNTEKPPLDNPKVRRALAFSLPYEDATTAAMGGYATPSISMLPPTLWGHTDKVQQYTFKPALAKELLAEAGYPDGLDDKLLAIMPEQEPMRKTAELWKSELAKLGIELEIRAGPPGPRYEMARSPDPQKRQDIFILWWWPNWVHPNSFLSSLIHSEDEPAWNLSYYDDPFIDKLLDKGLDLSAVDRDAASELYFEIQNIVANQAPGIPIFDVQYVTLRRSSLKGVEHDPAWLDVIYWYDCYREK